MQILVAENRDFRSFTEILNLHNGERDLDFDCLGLCRDFLTLSVKNIGISGLLQ
jgi:hypothetical protein